MFMPGRSLRGFYGAEKMEAKQDVSLEKVPLLQIVFRFNSTLRVEYVWIHVLGVHFDLLI